jgi:hypothetical protein
MHNKKSKQKTNKKHNQTTKIGTTCINQATTNKTQNIIKITTIGNKCIHQKSKIKNI